MAFNGLNFRVQEALPALFGLSPSDAHPDGLDPPWAWRDPEELAACLREAEERAARGQDTVAAIRRRMADLDTLAGARVAAASGGCS